MKISSPLRVCFALPGLHRACRGAETAFEAVADELAKNSGFEVTLIGSGKPREGERYRFVHAPSLERTRFERWPQVSLLRNEYRWEELSFVPGLWRAYRAEDFDVSVTCSYPFTNWVLRAGGGRRGKHVFVTQNGDWPVRRLNAEYRLFSCEGLVCTNPDYFRRHGDAWKSVLIPNGFHPEKIKPDACSRAQFGLPTDVKIVLMVSALIPSKRVLEALVAVARVPNVFFVVAGDGPQREAFCEIAERFLPGRHLRISLPSQEMAALYSCADVFLHMGRDEAFGSVYVEALGAGLPVVAHDSPTTRWIFQDGARGGDLAREEVDARNGTWAWLVDTNDSMAVSAAIVNALNSSTQAAQQRHAYAASRFSWKNITGQYGSFLEEIARS